MCATGINSRCCSQVAMADRCRGASKRNESLRVYIGSKSPAYRIYYITNTRVKNNQWESSVKAVKKAWVLCSEKWLAPLGPGDLVLGRFDRFLVILWDILIGGHVKLMGTRVLEPVEYPGFGHPQHPRVSSQTRTRYGFCPSGLYSPSTRDSIIRGTPLLCTHNNSVFSARTAVGRLLRFAKFTAENAIASKSGAQKTNRTRRKQATIIRKHLKTNRKKKRKSIAPPQRGTRQCWGLGLNCPAKIEIFWKSSRLKWRFWRPMFQSRLRIEDWLIQSFNTRYGDVEVWWA